MRKHGMAAKTVIDGLHMISVSGANVYLIDAPEGLTLIDTGFPDKEGKIAEAIRSVGRSEKELAHIILTHAHVDHIGSLAALKAVSGARTYMHATDAPIAESGGPFRPLTPSPELIGKIMLPIFVKPGATVAPATIDQHVADGEVLPIAGGLRAIHVPGHCAGQLAFFWKERGVLFAADACMNVLGLGLPIGFEDLEMGRRSLRTLAAQDFDIACFGHGKPVVGGAAKKFRAKWA